jgi:PAS domain-containing protein
MAHALQPGMSNPNVPAYEIGEGWRIVTANEAFCRTFKCAEPGLIGRDVRDLLRQDWRLDFRFYVSRALVGVGDLEVTLPMVAPCGDEAWFKHNLEPRLEDGRLTGYRATMEPHEVVKAGPPKRWWEWRPAPARQVWDFEPERLARAS